MRNYTGHCVTLIGTASIQGYLFKSNELKENSGASEAVYRALEYWREVNSPGLERILYIGGGNAAMLFRDKLAAKQAMKPWSLNLLEKTPGLRVIVAHHKVESTVRKAYQEALGSLFEHENLPAFGSDLGALPVVKNCPSTGLGASELYHDVDGDVWLSAEAVGKRNWEQDSYNRLTAAFQEYRGGVSPYVFPRKFSELGGVEGASQIAIVHTDGNGIGGLFSNVIDRNQTDEEFTKELADLSEKITKTARESFLKTISELVEVTHEPTKEDFKIPLRGIVWGGDDLTFVCHGRLALSVATRHLANFEAKSKEILGQKLTACAGVVIMPEKFPFSRGYELAERLCDSAKKESRNAANDGKPGSWLDFQLILEGSGRSLGSTRDILYGNGGQQKRLLRRPYCIDGTAFGEHSWQEFENRWKFFKNKELWPRNRAKRLFEGIFKGGPVLDDLLHAFESRGFTLPEGSVEACFDPLEMLDFHTILDWSTGESSLAAGGSQ